MSEIIQQRVETAVLNRLPGSRPLGKASLVEADLPEGLRHFLIRTLDRRVHLETMQLLDREAGWIDTNHPAFSEAGAQLAEQLQPAGQFPPEEWVKTVPQAVEALLAYLQEPARALASFAFSSESPTLPASDLRRRTGYFCDYPYMAKAVDAWLAKRNEQEIDRTAFESAMRHLDCRLTADYTADQWIHLLQPLVDTMRFAGVQPAGLPVGMVTLFFEAKERPTIASLIRSAAAVHRAEMITLPSLKDIILKAFENERIQEADRVDESAPMPGPATKDESPKERSPAPSDGSDEQPMPLWKRFQQRVDGPSPNTPSGTKPEAEPLWKSFKQTDAPRTVEQTLVQNASSSESSAAQPGAARPEEEAPQVQAQHIVLGTAVRSRDRFIRDLFDGDEAMYSDVMEQLSEAPDWTEASSIIADRIFRPYRIDIYSDVAVDFTNAVEARYSGFSS